MIEQYISKYFAKTGSVTVNGLGKFELEQVPATSQDEGHKILPPRQVIVFDENDQNDGALATYIVSQTGSDSTQKIEEEIAKFVSETKEKIKSMSSSEIKGLGKLELGLYGSITFHPDEHAEDITDSFGLPHIQATPFLEEEAETISIKPIANRKKQDRTTLLLVVILIPLALIGAGLVYVFFNPDIYSQITQTDRKPEKQEKIQEEQTPVAEDTVADEPAAADLSSKDLVITQKQNRFFLIIGSQSSLERGQKAAKDLRAEGFETAKVISADGRFRISAADFADRAPADQFKDKNKNKFQGIWVFPY